MRASPSFYFVSTARGTAFLFRERSVSQLKKNKVDACTAKETVNYVAFSSSFIREKSSKPRLQMRSTADEVPGKVNDCTSFPERV